MTGDPTTPPRPDGWEQTSGPAACPPLGHGDYPAAVEELFAKRARSRRGVPAVSVAAGVCGLLGFFLGPFLVGDTPDHYLVLALDLAALGAGAAGVWAAVRYRARFDWAVLGILTGAVSLGLYAMYLADPPAAPAGGT